MRWQRRCGPVLPPGLADMVGDLDDAPDVSLLDLAHQFGDVGGLDSRCPAGGQFHRIGQAVGVHMFDGSAGLSFDLE